ncbi:MAG TPA: YoaK family protein, partial [Steroidobacteraceae bacterium]
MATSPDTGPRELAIGLALIAGYVDAYALFAYSVFVSFMSGNTTSTGSALGQGHLSLAVPTGLAILFFVVGSFVGTSLTQSTLRHPRRALFGTIAALLALIIVGTQPAAPVLPPNLSISMLALAMGLVNTAQTRIGAEPVSLTFVTGALNKIGAHLALALRRAPLPNARGEADTHLRRAGV